MSRVSYVMMHPGSASELTAAIRTCVDGMIADLCGQAGADATDVLELTIVGNPIMHHLFLGLDPTELGRAVRPRDRRGRASWCSRARSHDDERERACTCCRASPDTWAPTPPA